MPAPLEPPELARLVDFAERPREGDWSLRSALTRYAQPQPERVSQVLELVRRIELALRSYAEVVDRDGPLLWQVLGSGATPEPGPSAIVIGVLQAAAELDRLADLLASWAVDRAVNRPDAAVDAVVIDITQRLDALGVAREERQRPPARGR
ncbi:MAG: hypothetical protein ABIV94_07090 [Acidimicrobiales bacterium]